MKSQADGTYSNDIHSVISLEPPEHYFKDVFHKITYSKEQLICNILLHKSFLGLSNLSECHLTL